MGEGGVGEQLYLTGKSGKRGNCYRICQFMDELIESNLVRCF